MHDFSTAPRAIAADHAALHDHSSIAPAAIASILLLFAVPAAQPDDASAVNLPTPQVTLSLAPQVFEACHSKSEAGCTVFAPVEFRCACSSDGNRWWIAAHVSATARVYVSNPSYVRHELQHVFDFRSRLKAYVASVVGRRYATEADCERGSEEAKASFTTAVAEVVRITVQNRDTRPLPPTMLVSRKR